MRVQGRSGLSNAFEIVSGEVRSRDRDRYLAVLYAAGEVRPALMALHALDLELAQVVAGTTEPMVGEIRLAWWREALLGLDAGTVPAQPLLQLLASEVLPRGVSGTMLAGLEDRWLGLIGCDAVPEAHFSGGGDLFAMAAIVVGSDVALGRRLGLQWASGDDAPDGKVPRELRPLLGLLRLAQRDAARARAGQPREARGSLARQWRLLRAIVFGR